MYSHAKGGTLNGIGRGPRLGVGRSEDDERGHVDLDPAAEAQFIGVPGHDRQLSTATCAQLHQNLRSIERCSAALPFSYFGMYDSRTLVPSAIGMRTLGTTSGMTARR